jgi:hypothetical protein
VTKLDGTAKGGILFAIAERSGAVPLHRRRRADRGPAPLRRGCPRRTRHRCPDGALTDRRNDRVRTRHQALPGARRRPADLSFGSSRRDGLPHRPLRRRQEHPAAPDRPAGAPDPRPGPRRGRDLALPAAATHPGAPPAHRHGLPGPSACCRPQRLRQRRAAAGHRRHGRAEIGQSVRAALDQVGLLRSSARCR